MNYLINYFDHDSITPLNPVIFELGPLTLRWYGLLIGIGMFLAVLAAIKFGKKQGFTAEFVTDVVIFGIPLSIIGARLYFVLFNLDYFLRHPARIVTGFGAGLAIHGGIIVAGLFSWWYLKKRKVPLLPFLDIVSVGFFIGQIIGRFGNFFNQEAYGRVIAGANLDAQRSFLTNLFIPRFIVDGMFINGDYHHPTFLYEALWNLVGLLIAVFVLRKLKQVLVGEIAAFYALWYSFGRFFIEALRTDSLMIGPLMTAQVISIATIIAVGGFVIYRRKTKKFIVPFCEFNLTDFQESERKKNNYQKNNTKTKKRG